MRWRYRVSTKEQSEGLNYLCLRSSGNPCWGFAVVNIERPFAIEMIQICTCYRLQHSVTTCQMDTANLQLHRVGKQPGDVASLTLVWREFLWHCQLFSYTQAHLQSSQQLSWKHFTVSCGWRPWGWGAWREKSGKFQSKEVQGPPDSGNATVFQ